MKKMIMFSIIMPVYNNEKYFPMAVKSILEQDYTNFELIIVDDGSTDKTSELADKIASQDKRVHVIHQENQWIYASFNEGIQKAQGEYIYIVNSDDKLLPGALSLMAEKVNKYNPDIIWTRVVKKNYDSKQNVIKTNKSKENEIIIQERHYKSSKDVREAWPYFVSSSLAYNQANLYRRKIMQKQKFRNDIYGADVFYNISIASEINSALVIKEPIYSYYIYDNGLMNASIGKYYVYEHSMLNDIFTKYKALFQEWGLLPENYLEILYQKRLIGLSTELRNLQAVNCPLSLEEKLQFAFSSSIDEIIEECASENNRQEELESRILSAVRELFIKESIDKESNMYFVYELLESLLRYEKDEEDFRKIEYAINHPLNPHHIGNTFYIKLIQGQKREKERTASEDV